jgi:hypothetical protein
MAGMAEPTKEQWRVVTAGDMLFYVTGAALVLVLALWLLNSHNRLLWLLAGIAFGLYPGFAICQHYSSLARTDKSL